MELYGVLRMYFVVAYCGWKSFHMVRSKTANVVASRARGMKWNERLSLPTKKNHFGVGTAYSYWGCVAINIIFSQRYYYDWVKTWLWCRRICGREASCSDYLLPRSATRDGREHIHTWFPRHAANRSLVIGWRPSFGAKPASRQRRAVFGVR